MVRLGVTSHLGRPFWESAAILKAKGTQKNQQGLYQQLPKKPCPEQADGLCLRSS